MQADSGRAASHLLLNQFFEVDLQTVQQATGQEVDERISLGLIQCSFYSVKRSLLEAKARPPIHFGKKDLDDVWAQHTELMEHLRELQDRAAEESNSYESNLNLLASGLS